MQWVKDVVLLYWVAHRTNRLCWSNLLVSPCFSPQRLAPIYRQFRAFPPYFLRRLTLRYAIGIDPLGRQDRNKETIACDVTQRITEGLSGNQYLERKCRMLETPTVTLANTRVTIQSSVLLHYLCVACDV
jgi:hypothetical protein